ncbi:LapA family protein [Paludisphaera rhizosphaerae]|uniref:lipopolysaccharide assembly protein LapA domain-containing protein n=1 Tax=Paludisphaera rhizosphaerae TaxID=2711216 RepID=UPI0013EA9E2D|nr:lipopolysaccharide assembly protein LapA domain-containing protein [Paludisphaera rhizosphaerae]
MRYVSGVLAVLLFLMVVAFSLQNRESVTLTFLAWSTSLPKIFLILGTYVLGMLSGWGFVTLVKQAF